MHLQSIPIYAKEKTFQVNDKNVAANENVIKLRDKNYKFSKGFTVSVTYKDVAEKEK